MITLLRCWRLGDAGALSVLLGTFSTLFTPGLLLAVDADTLDARTSHASAALTAFVLDRRDRAGGGTTEDVKALLDPLDELTHPAVVHLATVLEGDGSVDVAGVNKAVDAFQYG